jgi:glycosyltransferase involved in cell wall biosynthesis
LKIALLCGPCPAGGCGVGDYSRCLGNALNSIGIESRVIAAGDWRLQSVMERLRSIRTLNPDVVHIQYPTVGFARHLGPQAFSVLKSCVATIHEVSQAHLLRKLALYPFSFRARHVIFPSNFERRFAVKWAPWIAHRSSVIGIPSNISAGAKQQRNSGEIVHFGLIMPGKGLEKVIRLGRLIQVSGHALRIRVIGTVRSDHAGYFEALRSESSHLPIVWENGLDKKQVEDRLAASAIAYLPYPDGVSERRATLKAALINGTAVITTHGAQTPSDIQGSVCFVETPEEALVAALDLLASPEKRDRLSSNGMEYAGRYTWERIAEQHSALYDEILIGRRTEVFPVENTNPRASSSSL